MQFKDLKKIIYNDKTSLKDVLENIGKYAEYTERKGFGIITNHDGKCIGVVTDGDIRRQLLKGIDLSASIKHVMNKGYKYVLASNKDIV